MPAVGMRSQHRQRQECSLLPRLRVTVCASACREAGNPVLKQGSFLELITWCAPRVRHIAGLTLTWLTAGDTRCAQLSATAAPTGFVPELVAAGAGIEGGR